MALLLVLAFLLPSAGSAGSTPSEAAPQGPAASAPAPAAESVSASPPPSDPTPATVDPLPPAPALLPSPRPGPDAAPGLPVCSAAGPLGPLGTAARDLARLAELSGAAPVRPDLFLRASSSRELILCQGRAPHPSAVAPETPPAGLRATPGVLGLRSYYRTAYPQDVNDGAVWQGRGLTLAAFFGGDVRWGPLSAAVAPLAAWVSNRHFAAQRSADPNLSTWANPFSGSIDLPLRFGGEPFYVLDAGDSYARLDAWNVALGVSNENLWWGPGVRNAVLFTNTAPGFPHAFVGTSRPADVWIGWVDVQLVWGLLRESPYFTPSRADDRRFLTAFAISFEPAFAPGLFLGLGRVYHFSDIPAVQDWFRPVASPFFKEKLASPSNPSGNDTENQLASLMARWVFPEARLELYGEWGRDDHSWDTADFLQEPAHAAAFVLGLQHLARVRDRWVRIALEATHTTERPLRRGWRPDPVFYSHHLVRQGHTHEGQMLGASLGPSGDDQYLAVDVLGQDGGSFGIYAARTLRNERWYDDHVNAIFAHDLEMSWGLRQRLALGEVDLAWELGAAYRYNAYFGPSRWNAAASLALSWWPGRSAAPALPPP